MPQERIEALIAERALAGNSVVRLKGGDPFVFGRGGEEAETLREAGVEFEIVPGVTAGIAATAYAGIPVTHRDDASAVAFVTGHEDPEKPESAIDWPALAAFPGTLVLYMGVKNLPAISRNLIEAGRDPDQPAAAVMRGTHADQRAVVATVATLPEAVAEAGLKAPSILLFGDVARHRERIAWLERRPLHGRRIVVTRARAQASGLAGTLARARRRGRRAARDPDRAADRQRRGRGGAGGAPHLRADLPDEPERRPPAVRGDGRPRPRRPRARRRDDRRDRPRHRPRARAPAASSPTSCRRARSPSR